VYESEVTDMMLKNKLKKIQPQIVNQPLYADEIQAIFHEQFEELGVEVTTHPYGDEIGENQVTASGYFEAQEWDFEEFMDPVDLINIELQLILHNEDRPICINNTDWLFLKHQVEQTIAHEMIHRDQSKKRFIVKGGESYPIYDDHLSEEDKRIVYLSDPDEIDAYANDIALDLLRGYTYMQAYARLREYNKITQEESPILCEYIDTFGWNSETVHTLLKKALKRLET
jgi:hypothetical protein